MSCISVTFFDKFGCCIIVTTLLMFDLELQKFCGARFFSWDLELYHEVSPNSAKIF